MAHLGMLKHTLCSSRAWKPCFASIHNIRVWEKKSLEDEGSTVSARECVCLERDRIWKRRRSQIGFLWCLSHAVSPYQPGSLTKARDPCQAVLDNWMWPECSWETEGDLRKVGWIRRTSPVCLSQTRIKPRCRHAHAHTHTHCMQGFDTL